MAFVELLVSETATPPTGAGALNVTRPVAPAPPTTDTGSTVTDVNVSCWTTGAIVNGTLSTTFPSAARMERTVTAFTAVVATVNVPDVAPGWIISVG